MNQNTEQEVALLQLQFASQKRSKGKRERCSHEREDDDMCEGGGSIRSKRNQMQASPLTVTHLGRQQTYSKNFVARWDLSKYHCIQIVTVNGFTVRWEICILIHFDDMTLILAFN